MRAQKAMKGRIEKWLPLVFTAQGYAAFRCGLFGVRQYKAPLVEPDTTLVESGILSTTVTHWWLD